MSLNDTPRAERLQIGFFGLRNAGKSTLCNRITAQEMSLVSDVKGTTTDPVSKSMELLPLGPVTIIDTPGFDDTGMLGEQRVRRTREVLRDCDLAVLVTEHDTFTEEEEELERLIKERGIPCLIVQTKEDGMPRQIPGRIAASGATGEGVEEVKEQLARLGKGREKTVRFVADLIQPGDTVVLVIPIDSSAPKGRLILPQQQAVRDILDLGAYSVVTGVEGIPEVLQNLKTPPALVVTDSQVFGKVMKLVPEEIPLTSFSILMARYKGFLAQAVQGAAALDHLEDRARVLISEGCTHHRQCEDIGTVKLPKWIREYTGKAVDFTFTSGLGYPEALEDYDLIVHCGACMLTDQEVQNRMQAAKAAGVPFTIYGTLIAKINGILERSIACVPV